MKYIAVIGSHTQLLSAVGTFNLIGNLKKDDVLIVFIRNYKNTLVTLPFLQIDANDFYNLSDSVIRNKNKRNELISKIDTIVNDFCNGNSFYAIVPHISTAFFQILTTNKNCIGVKFIQEGAKILKGRFQDNLTLDKILFTLYNTLVLNEKRCWRTHKWIIPSFLKKKLSFETYALSDFFKFMEGIDKHFVIKWPTVEFDYAIDINTPCFVFDGYVEMKWIDASSYYKIIDKMVLEQAKSVNYVKFHPAQTNENRQAIQEIFVKQNREIILLPDSIPFELFLTKYNSLKVIGFSSSLLDFAVQLNNHKVISYTDDLLKISKTFKQKVSQSL